MVNLLVNSTSYMRKLWTDRLTVTEYQDVIMPNKSTGSEEVVVMEDVACKLSFSTLRTTDQGELAAGIGQTTKLFLDRSVDIKPGSKLTVTRCGQVLTYKNSGLPGMFHSHQEIVLVPFEEWA